MPALSALARPQPGPYPITYEEANRAMNLPIALPLLLGLVGADSEPAGEGQVQAAAALREQLLKLHTADAAEYVIYRDEDHKEKAELVRKPVYVWTNPVRVHKQDGAVFVWTYRGRPEALGCIFSGSTGHDRGITHEFHSLSLGVLDVEREGRHAKTWSPGAPGLVLKPIVGAPKPEATAPKRLLQMRTLSREFSAHSKDGKGNRWELRLLPQPLYRYESTDPDVLDGGLFAFVTSAGTDPEVLLAIEARRLADRQEHVWQFGVARFSDLALSVKHQGEEVFDAPLVQGNMPQLYPKQQYWVFGDRFVPLLDAEAR